MSILDPFKAFLVDAVDSQEKLINMLTAHIGGLEVHIGERPGPDVPVNGKRFRKWDRLAFTKIGEVVGMLRICKALSLITGEQYKSLHFRAMVAINRVIADALMGRV